MNIHVKKLSSTLLLSSLVFLYGCTVSTVPEDKERDQAAATDTAAPHLAQPEEKRLLDPTPPAPTKNVLIKKAKGMDYPAEASTRYQMTVAGSLSPHDEMASDTPRQPVYPQFNRESYNAITENPFIATTNDPLSTFSIDVDTASYANVRRWLTSGSLPPIGAVRIEEMINYFSYNYPEPKEGPIGITSELGPCPWQPENKLVRIGIKAKDLDSANLPPSNLVFLIDVSGSMNQANKLPLLQQSMLLLLEKLTKQDRVSIVVYAGADHVVLQPTWGDQKELIRKAITTLSAGGSTHASSGILTAYDLAKQSFITNGNNRIILASDGDFNVGVTSRGELERLVAKERDSGIYLTVLGFGMGNYHDDSMEILADKGNGNYSYIDSLLEAKKVLIKERSGTLFTLASDVKLQIEFNPARVGGYRLIGYENRALADEDFNNDKKDAGEIGAGHTVTALYELLPAQSKMIPKVDALRYQTQALANNSDEIVTIKLRYKPINAGSSLLMTKHVKDSNSTFQATSDDFRFSSAVAAFGMLLRQSNYLNKLSYPELMEIARDSRGADREGYRAEFIHLLELSELLGNKK